MKKLVQATRYEIQYTIAVNNPENKVYAKCEKGVWKIHIPINYPFVHNLSLRELLDVADAARLLRMSTPLNNNSEG